MQEGQGTDAAEAPAGGDEASRGTVAAGADAAPGDDQRERVAAVLDQLRAGVRQRRAELATLGPSAGGATAAGDAGELHSKLLQVRQSEYVREPVPSSHRPGLGRWIVLARKAGYKLFGKWLVRPLLEQQNAHNQATAALLQQLAENEVRLAHELRGLQARLASLEARQPPSGGAPGPSLPGEGREGLG